jgi:hypothetical protein
VPRVEPREIGSSIGEQTIQPTWAGEVLDLDLAVIAIRSRNGLAMMYEPNEKRAKNIAQHQEAGTEGIQAAR